MVAAVGVTVSPRPLTFSRFRGGFLTAAPAQIASIINAQISAVCFSTVLIPDVSTSTSSPRLQVLSNLPCHYAPFDAGMFRRDGVEVLGSLARARTSPQVKTNTNTVKLPLAAS